MKLSVLRILFLLTLMVGLSIGSAQAARGKVSSLKGKASFVPGEVLVRLKEGASASDKAKITAMGTAKASFIPNVFKVELVQDQDVLQAIETLKNNPAV